MDFHLEVSRRDWLAALEGLPAGNQVILHGQCFVSGWGMRKLGPVSIKLVRQSSLGRGVFEGRILTGHLATAAIGEARMWGPSESAGLTDDEILAQYPIQIHPRATSPYPVGATVFAFIGLALVVLGIIGLAKLIKAFL